MKKMVKQQGFTLIELIAVIVILGILAATAVPKFIDMSQAAKSSGLNGLAGSLNSASSVNFAAYSACRAKLAGADLAAVVDTTGDTCAAAAARFVTINSNYTVNTGNLGANGTPTTCTVAADVDGDGTTENIASGETVEFTMYSVDKTGLSCT